MTRKLVEIPELPFPFRPRWYQEKLMAQVKMSNQYQWRKPGTRHISVVDPASPDGDRTMVTHAKLNGRGEIIKIWVDEYENWPEYKWWRQPIKWLQWKLLWWRIGRQYKERGKQ